MTSSTLLCQQQSGAFIDLTVSESCHLRAALRIPRADKVVTYVMRASITCHRPAVQLQLHILPGIRSDRTSTGAGGGRRTFPETFAEAGSALRSRPRDGRRHTAYVISTTGGIRRTSQATSSMTRDGGRLVPFDRRELERLIDPGIGAAQCALMLSVALLGIGRHQVQLGQEPNRRTFRRT